MLATKERLVAKGNQQFLSMALAYIEIGKVAALAESDLKNTHEYENAVAYQLYHAVELFYKYMLSKKGITKKGHDIAVLEEEFKRLFPGERFQIKHPFDFSNYEACELNPGELQLAKAHMEKYKPEIMDQHLRYPSGNNTGGYSYSFDSNYFESIKDQILRVSAIDC